MKKLDYYYKLYLSMVHMDEGNGNTRLPYGLAKGQGIDTEGMTPREAWNALEDKTGASHDEVLKELNKGTNVKKTGRKTEINGKNLIAKMEIRKKYDAVSRILTDTYYDDEYLLNDYTEEEIVPGEYTRGKRDPKSYPSDAEKAEDFDEQYKEYMDVIESYEKRNKEKDWMYEDAKKEIKKMDAFMKAVEKRKEVEDQFSKLSDEMVKYDTGVEKEYEFSIDPQKTKKWEAMSYEKIKELKEKTKEKYNKMENDLGNIFRFKSDREKFEFDYQILMDKYEKTHSKDTKKQIDKMDKLREEGKEYLKLKKEREILGELYVKKKKAYEDEHFLDYYPMV